MFTAWVPLTGTALTTMSQPLTSHIFVTEGELVTLWNLERLVKESEANRYKIATDKFRESYSSYLYTITLKYNIPESVVLAQMNNVMKEKR